jgi:meso-butanediol dehydrogenase / (S,S)-butanediol dehydrogenase / diacetyl reductase
MEGGLAGCNLVVSGAAGGVGRALLEYGLARGCSLVGVDRRPSAPLGDAGRVELLQADLSRWKEVARVGERIGHLLPAVDVLVNAAGVFAPDDHPEGPAGVLPGLLQDNVETAAYLSMALLPLLRRGRKPLVVNVSSTDGVVASGGRGCEVGAVHDSFYAASKGALITLTRSLAMKWAPEGIRVNALCPTIIRTPMAADVLATPGKEEELRRHLPLSRICEPEDVAVAVDCLYRLELTTAHVLPLDAGYLCR